MSLLAAVEDRAGVRAGDPCARWGGSRQGNQDAAEGRARGGRTHEGDARLALAHGLSPAAAAHLGEHGCVEGGAVQAGARPVRLLPGQQDLSGGSGTHGECGTSGNRVAQAHLAFGGGHAHAVIALAAEELEDSRWSRRA